MSVTQRVLEQYPSLSFLLKDPEVGALLRDAVNPNKGFSPQTFQAKLYETKWWRSRSETQRTWEILTKTDPGSAKQQVTSLRHSVREYANQLGVNLTPAQTLWIASLMAQRGVNDPRDRQIRLEILRTPQAVNPGTGAIRTSREQLRHAAKSEFLRNPTVGGLRHWGNLLASGEKTIEDYISSQMWEAKRRFPHMRELLEQGLTPGQIVAANRELVAQELEMEPGQVDVIGSATWRQLTGIKDPKSGKMRLPTESEVIKLARSQDKWWKTSHGRETDANATRSMLQIMGVRR